MLLQDFPPSPPLRAYIRCYRVVDLAFDPAQQVPYKLYPPKPEQVLHFILQGPLWVATPPGAKRMLDTICFVGQQTQSVYQYTGPKFVGVQIVFQPTAVVQLTGIPAAALANQWLDARHLFPNLPATHDRLGNAADYAGMLRILDECALEWVRHAKQQAAHLDMACSSMKALYGRVAIHWLAGQSGYSMRQFNRHFTERVGVGPKTYAQLLRLNRAYNMRNCFPSTSWPAIASACGYADYQHLAKDYQLFNGLTPAALHTLEAASPEQVLGLSRYLYRSRYFAV